jgi:hypothetical protein
MAEVIEVPLVKLNKMIGNDAFSQSLPRRGQLSGQRRINKSRSGSNDWKVVTRKRKKRLLR